jgi:hypothetical protein
VVTVLRVAPVSVRVVVDVEVAVPRGPVVLRVVTRPAAGCAMTDVVTAAASTETAARRREVVRRMGWLLMG